ncbi:hypothetical protein NSK_004253 [Nannochloropsis salina CCMP1776]|uniref:Pyruvate carboxylase n=1 Tax=Nannochloropsis salina CCMP1776 TaxID=1027361 RepID=A0A4D9CY33_9STRA|nr:hypothetical protein NSK_004253 [Nannochloropsis salina CCMP1776]|eukprot:TFJ84262.1 hypothetical protein NSK_004253 [Nannochloropsis salina CCMP1776]
MALQARLLTRSLRGLGNGRLPFTSPRCNPRLWHHASLSSFTRGGPPSPHPLGVLSTRLPGVRHPQRSLSSPAPTSEEPPFKKLMAANRGEIATRIMRATTELGIASVGIFSKEDRFTQHRYKADQAFLVGADKSPVGAYLDIDSIIQTAKRNGVDAIHPGYGLLSENPNFARACAENGIVFVGPTVEQLITFGDKTKARELAIKAGVPVVPGTDGPVSTYEEARSFIEGMDVGYPVIIKAAHGGGGRGMRVVRSADELEENFKRASSEALSAFGNGEVFIEHYVDQPRHIEVQILGDGRGNVVHLYDRDCSVQRRHQKVVEMAPAEGLPEATRQALFQDSLRLTGAAKYLCAGTVEFLVDKQGRHFFIEVNPRVQVEHTVTEEVTGIDVVQSQIRLAAGASLEELGLVQEKIKTYGYAMQCRVTTEDPSRDFQPDSGHIEVFRAPGGMGIRIDDGPGFAANRHDAIMKLQRALKEFRVRGVHTNKSFVLNLLSHPDFIHGQVDTGFIARNPALLQPVWSSNRGQKLLKFIGNVIVNGPEPSLGATGPPCSPIDPIVPTLSPLPPRKEKSLRQIYLERGPKGFAQAVRKHKGTLITDTTWRDAHQSLLATRVRTRDLLRIAEATGIALAPAYSLENWGGATFDVSMRFLREDPWDRLGAMREAVPDIPFQMLLRGANAVGYTSYPDNVVFKFCELAQKHGMDVFRIFDSLNYLENMRLGIDAVGAAGGIVEAAICYTGDITDPHRKPYTLDYYLEFARQLVGLGVHVLAVKDMAGLLKPEAASLLVGSLRKEFPDVPLHLHTHDSAGTGVASMIAGAKAGADAVDAAMDALSGTTSQPSLGAIVGALRHTPYDTGMDMKAINAVNEYWEECRGLYAPFESGQKSGSSDVYDHEMPGGQLTNLMFQSTQLGLAGQWGQIKKAYAAANRLLGDIIKVTPSSKVVGDLAQFMVQNKLTEEDVRKRAEELSFPSSVIEYFQGYLGIPPFGFPEPLRTHVLKGRTLPNGKACFEGRPGAELPPFAFEDEKQGLLDLYGKHIRDVDVMTHAQYPQVFSKYQSFFKEYDDVSVLDTRTFLQGMKLGAEVSVELEHGKTLFVKLNSVGQVDATGHRDVIFELNGQQRVIKTKDTKADVNVKVRPKADLGIPGSVGAPMPGLVVEVKVKVGQAVKKGQPLLVLSAMKMETVLTSPAAGTVKTLLVGAGDNIAGGDLVVEIE